VPASPGAASSSSPGSAARAISASIRATASAEIRLAIRAVSACSACRLAVPMIRRTRSRAGGLDLLALQVRQQLLTDLAGLALLLAYVRGQPLRRLVSVRDRALPEPEIPPDIGPVSLDRPAVPLIQPQLIRSYAGWRGLGELRGYFLNAGMSASRAAQLPDQPARGRWTRPVPPGPLCCARGPQARSGTRSRPCPRRGKPRRPSSTGRATAGW
jgi:hypothetical protein